MVIKNSSHSLPVLLKMGKFSIFALIFALQGVVTTAVAKAAPTASNENYILIVNSDSFRESWSKELYSKIRTQVRSYNIPLETHELEFTSINNIETGRLKLDSIAATYQKKPTMVIMIYDPAWLLCKPLFDNQWKGIPILLIAPNPTVQRSWQDAVEQKVSPADLIPIQESIRGYNVMIIKQEYFFQKTIELMRQLQPNMNSVTFILDDNFMSRCVKESFMEFFTKNYPTYRLDFLNGASLSTDVLLDSLSSYSEQTGILYFSWLHRCQNHVKYSITEHLHRLVNGFTKSPVFTLQDLNVTNTEFAGGCFISASDYALTVCSIIEQTLHGTPLQEIKTAKRQERIYLNYKNLLYSRIPTSLYPSTAIYYDSPPSFVEKHIIEMIIGMLFIIFLIAYTVIRAIYIKKTNLFKLQDKLMLEQLQGLINNMPIGYARIQMTPHPTTQKNQYVYLDINPAFVSLFNCNRQKIIGKKQTEIASMYPAMANIVNNEVSSFEGRTKDGSILYLDKIHFHHLSTDILEIFCIDRTERENILEQLRSSTLELKDTNKQLQLSMIASGMISTTWMVNEGCFEYNINAFDENEKLISQHYRLTEQEYFALIHPNDSESVRQICQEVKDCYRNSINIEYRLLLPGNTNYLWMHVQAATIEKTINGRTLVMSGILTDIDKRKKMELKVLEAQEAEKEYKRQLQLSLVAGKMETTKWDIQKGLFYYDVTIMNDNNELNNYQYTLNEAQYLETIHPDDRDMIIQTLEITKEGKRINLQMEYRLKKEGANEYEWVEVQDFASEFNEEGIPTVLVGVRRNINKRKVLEIEMSQAKAVQEQHNRQLKLSLIARQMVIATWDLINRQFTYNLYSIDATGALTTNINIISEEQFFAQMHPDDVERTRRLCQQSRSGERSSIKTEYRTNLTLDNPKEYVWTEAHINTVEVGPDGKPTKMIGVEMNIDKRKKMELDLIRAKEEAEESNLLKSAFLANMSHEIRTPLNAIVGFSDLLTTTEDPDDRAEFLSIIKNNNNLLLQLIDDVLNISRIEAGKLDFDYSNVNIHHLFCEMEDSSNIRQKNPETPIVFDKSTPEYTIYTDRHRVMQVIGNFINNAMKFTPTGSIEIGYQMETNQCIYMYVKDTGCGISEENCCKVFDRFVKLDTFKQGTGLGLSICSSLIEKMSGEIGVNSSLGSGSTFWIKLPTVDTEPSELKELHDKTQPAIANTPQILIQGSMKTILIAEDNESNFKLFESILKNKFHLLHGWDGQQAVDLFKNNVVDLILMDIKMPIMNGFQAIKLIRQISSTVPIIAATASVFPAEQRKIRGHGFNDFIAKPINSSLLMEMVAKQLNS